MNARNAIREACKHNGTSLAELARTLGKERHYGTGITRGVAKIDTFASIMDALGYDVVARSRGDGYEFVVPPK